MHLYRGIFCYNEIVSNYEIQQAKEDLNSIKDKVRLYLREHYPEDKKDTAQEVFEYLERIVTKVIKRQKLNLSWGSGASPCWHASIFLMLSAWIEAEVSLSVAISDALK